MSIQKYQQARQLIEEAGEGDFEGAKTESLVAKAETALGLTFPPSYRRFLLEMGCGDIGGFEVYGLIDDKFENSTVPNAIWITLDERRVNGLDPAYVIVGDSGDGSYLCINTKQVDKAGEAPVIRLSVDEEDTEKVADSFGDYFLDGVREVV